MVILSVAMRENNALSRLKVTAPIDDFELYSYEVFAA